jgi:dTDP-4-dehydrorhamnose reductase
LQFLFCHGSFGLIKNSNRIGITGWTGSIGSNATSCIKVQSRLEDPLDKILQEFNELNLDVYIHLAALTNIALCSKNEEDAFMLNSEMPLKFLKAADAAGIKRFIFISTSHVYDHKKKPPYDIDSDTCPTTIYAKSKLLAEKKLMRYQSKTKIQV